MYPDNLSPREKEEEFNKKIIRDYLKYGSVDEVFRRNRYTLPTSHASFHRLLDKWGIVKAAGPNTRISEVVAFMEHLALEKIPLETLYRKLPPSFKTSKVTLHRVLSYVKKGVTRRGATALVITPEDDAFSVLTGNDVSTPRLEFGKPFGSVSLPMGFSKKTESSQTSIKRLLQREVFTDLTVEKQFPEEILSTVHTPFMHFHIADIKVSVFHLTLPEKLCAQTTSQILKDLRFSPLEEVLKKTNLRAGITEIVNCYAKVLEENNPASLPVTETSPINLALALDPWIRT